MSRHQQKASRKKKSTAPRTLVSKAKVAFLSSNDASALRRISRKKKTKNSLERLPARGRGCRSGGGGGRHCFQSAEIERSLRRRRALGERESLAALSVSALPIRGSFRSRLRVWSACRPEEGGQRTEKELQKRKRGRERGAPCKWKKERKKK